VAITTYRLKVCAIANWPVEVVALPACFSWQLLPFVIRITDIPCALPRYPSGDLDMGFGLHSQSGPTGFACREALGNQEPCPPTLSSDAST
jgi:hypothetical protein